MTKKGENTKSKADPIKEFGENLSKLGGALTLLITVPILIILFILFMC